MKRFLKFLKKLRQPRQIQTITNSTIGGSVTQIQGGRDVHL